MPLRHRPLCTLMALLSVRVSGGPRRVLEGPLQTEESHGSPSAVGTSPYRFTKAAEFAASPVAAAGRTTAGEDVRSSPHGHGRSRLADDHLLPTGGHDGAGDSEGETESGVAAVEGDSHHGSRKGSSHIINLAQSLKTFKSVFSSHNSKARQQTWQSATTAKREAALHRLRLTPSMLPERKEYKDAKTTRIVKWLNYRICMESFFAFYSLWTLQRALVLCCLGMLVFLCLGITLIVLNDKHVECKLNYEEYSLGEGSTNYVCLPITSDACGPGRNITELEGEEIYVYYELENFNQNGGQIVWNRNDKQLAGHIFTDPSDVQDCEPYATKVVDNVTKVLHPCGALAWHVFNDNFVFFDSPPEGLGGSVNSLALMQTPEDILLPHRWQSLYKNPSAQEREAARDKVYFWMSVEDNDDTDGAGKPEEGLALAIQESLNFKEAGMMVENSHFIQWMHAAALPTFRKLYGKLKGPLKLPLYANISINYDVKPWGGKKAVVLVIPSAFYGRTLYIGIAYIVFGCILLLFSLYLLWRLHLAKDGTTSGDIRWRRLVTRNKRKSK